MGEGEGEEQQGGEVLGVGAALVVVVVVEGERLMHPAPLPLLELQGLLGRSRVRARWTAGLGCWW